jgi:hypothetical protein
VEELLLLVQTSSALVACPISRALGVIEQETLILLLGVWAASQVPDAIKHRTLRHNAI